MSLINAVQHVAAFYFISSELVLYSYQRLDFAQSTFSLDTCKSSQLLLAMFPCTVADTIIFLMMALQVGV